MALKDLYFKAEDGYYKFLDWVDAHGLPIYSLVDVFEDRGIPTFPIALIILIAIIAGIGLLAYGIVAPGTSSVMISVSYSLDGKPIANADVIITLPNGIVQTGNTTDEGKFLAKLPIGQEVGIKITKSGYKDKAMRFTAKKESESLPLVLELLRKTLSRTIQLLQKGTAELVKEEVAIEFSCSAVAEYKEMKTTSNGIIELSGIPENCGTLYAAPKNGFTTEQDAIELGTSGATVNVYLSGEARGKGAINVYVANEAQQAVAGIEINLKDEGGMQIAKKITGSSGSAVFSEIPAGKYYFVTYDASGKYAEYDGRAEINELLPDAVLQKNIALFTKAVGKIMLLLKDASTNAPVSNATVKLIKDGAELASKPSAIDGKVEFNVAENVSYDIAIDHPAYMLKTLTNVQKSAAFVDVLIAPATSANANSLKIKVVDEFALPVEDAKVRLHKASDDSIVGSELSTGINGEVAFERLEPGNYYAEVLKTGFGSAVSDVTAVVAREENSVVVRLPIGTGTFEVSVLDNEQKPLAAAKIEVYNAYTNAKLSENTTDLQGKKAIDERIDRKIYFVASASGYLKHTTIAYLPIRDVTQRIEIALAKDIAKLEVKVLGVFATEDLEIADSLSPGQKYIAKLQLLIPANSSFDEAGMHIRTGSDDALIMEKDAIYLRNIYASTSEITKGTSYTPSNNYATDALHLTTGNAKWANVAWKNASDGIYDAEAEIIVKDGIAIGTLTELQYRGWGKKGAYVRFPTDSTLGSSESSGSKQALYAQTNSLPLSIGPSNLCDDVFCYRLIVEDIAAGNLQTSIVDSYSAKVSNDYKFIFTITSKSSTTFAGSKLKIYNETGGLGFSGYEITTVTGAKIPGTLTGASLEIDVGDVATNSKFYGTLGIRTIKEGSTQLKLELISGNEKVMQKSIAINIAGAKALSIEVLPKIIVPFVQNNLLIRVTDANDGSALADAVVTILKDGTTLASGTTDFNGIFAYALASVSSGTSIEFRAEKSNYKQNSITMSASEDILEISPEKINETLTITGADRKDVELVLNNITELPLMISSISASGDLDGLATITFADTYEDSALPKGEDFNIGIILDLTDEGKRAEEITKLSGSIDISLESTDASTTWRMSVPVNITIGFGAEADDSSCLVINPDTWDLFASTGSKTLNIALQNNCEVSGEGIILREFSAKITQANDNALGTFEISSDIEDSGDVSLTNTYAEVAPLIEAGASATLKLEFEPEDVVSGEATYNIIFKAINKTTRGDEEISTQLKVNAKVNDLQECVEVIQSTELVIESCPYNLGYGSYGGSSGGSGGGYGYGGTYGGYGGGTGYGGGASYDPYQQWGYTPDQQPWTGSYDQLYANNYPYSNYQQPFYGSDYGTGGYGGVSGGIGSYGASFNCGKTSFTVRNNCSSAVEISLSSDPALIVDKATTELSAGDELESEVQAAYMVGNYPIDVKARVADSKESSTTIETLMVKVDNIFTKTWFDCVSLDKKKFQFNNFIGKPVSGKVFNDCYDSGVRLIYSADAIKISEGASAPQRMVQEVAVTGIFTEGAGDHTREVLQFDIIKDVRYKGERPSLSSSNPLQQIGNLRYALTAGYYTVESRATMSVEFITRYGTKERIPFNVTLEDLWLAAEVLPQEDIFGNQDPNFKLDQCINKDALDFTKLINTEDGCLPAGDQALFPDGLFTHPPAPVAAASTFGIGWYLPFYSATNSDNWVMKVSNKFCGSTDKIELGTTSLPEKQGVKVYFETAQNGHDIKVTVNTKGIKPNATVKFDGKVQIVATRPAKGETQQYALPFKFCVAGPKVSVIPITPTQVGLKCADGSTGDGAYEGYGFSHLKYNWDWGSIGKNECNKKNADDYTVCDATQFSVSLNKKADEIDALITNIAIGDGTFDMSDGDMATGGRTDNDDFRNSKELFRFVKEQLVVTKILSGQDNYVFFIGEDGLLENTESKISKKIQKLNEVNEAIREKVGDEKTWIKDIIKLYDSLFENPTPELRNVLVEIDSKGLSDTDIGTLHEIGAGKWVAGDKYVITYENFYTFYTNLKEAARPENHHPVIPDISAFSKFNFCVNGIKECYIEQLTTDNYELHKYIGSASRTIIRNKSSGNDAFLRNLYITGKLTFKIGIRNRPELSEKEKKIVLEKGAENTGLLPDGYDGYYPPTEKDAKDPNKHYFYPENIEFSPYLMHDGYSSDFKDDFKAAYENKINNKWKAGFSTQWNFKTKDGGALVIDKPALYSVFVDYEWEDAEKPNITVSVDTGKPAEELSETMRQNIFFYLPIDGLVGKENGQYKRIGYGTTWGPNVPADVPSVCGTSPPAGSACHTDVTGTDTGAEAKTEEKTTFFEDIVGIAPSSVNEGAEIFTVTSDIKYKAAQQGIVLSIDRSKGIYKSTMVNAVPVRLKIIKNSLDRGAGLFYELYTNSPNETTKMIAPGIIAVNTPAADPIINWTAVGGSDFSGGSVASGTAIPEQFANEGALCQGTGAYHAVLWDKVTNIGTVELKAIAYVPAKSTYGIQPLCGADTTILWNDEKSMTTIWPKDKAGKENPFILSEGKGEAAKEEFTIVKILDKLKNGQLCMKTTSNDVKFFWNADKLLESTSTVTPMEDMGH